MPPCRDGDAAPVLTETVNISSPPGRPNAPRFRRTADGVEHVRRTDLLPAVTAIRHPSGVNSEGLDRTAQTRHQRRRKSSSGHR